MAYVDKEVMLGLGLTDDPANSAGALESQLVALEDRLRELSDDANPLERAAIKLEMGKILVGLDRGEEAWRTARDSFDVFLEAGQWEKAVEVCDILFLADQPGSLSALGQGIWLGVTYPIDPELTLGMLHHVIDETPADSDGAAVAAATGAYVVDLRAEGKQRQDLGFFANQMLGTVARRHSDVQSQEQFDFWFKKLELDEPEKFLVRLRNVVDVLVQDDWWFDRDELVKTLPVN
jgi:hypothetical protein